MRTIKESWLFFMTTLMILTLSSCAAKLNFLHSDIVPAAEGNIVIKKDKNNNYQEKLEIRNLAQPQKLNPPRAVYVVWMVMGEDQPKNMGQIKITENAMTHALKGTFATVTPTKPRKIFITAENDANVQTPDDQVILNRDNI